MLLSLRKWSRAPRPRAMAVGAVLVTAGATIGLTLTGLAAPTAWAGTVTVQPGQNLTQIAAELRTTVAALVAANGLQDANVVLAGELLQIPASTAGVQGPRELVVEPGQTLSAIAARYGVSVASLVAANGLQDPNHVLAGEQLEIPTSAGVSPGPATVVVQPGQTLSAIAARYGVSVTSLASANGLHDPNYVMAGTTLLVPVSSGMALADYTRPLSTGGTTGGLPSQLAAQPGRLTLEPDFAAAAAAYGVPLPLLEALCWWESGWQAAIVSPTGAVGVCQIEPATATFVDEYVADTMLNPLVASENIDIGAAFLGSLLRQTDGDVSEALAGYYQGLASVRAYGMSSPTANYVKGIEAYAAIFAA